MTTEMNARWEESIGEHKRGRGEKNVKILFSLNEAHKYGDYVPFNRNQNILYELYEYTLLV